MAQVKCPGCGKAANPEEGFCIYCGYNFDGSEAPMTTFAPSYNPVIGSRKAVTEPVVEPSAETQPAVTEAAATPSPFAQNTDTQAALGGSSFDEPISDEPASSSGSPVIRFDSNSYSGPMPSYSGGGSSSGELMFGIGFSRILALFFAGIVIISMLVPFVTARISINKTMLPQGTNTQSLVKAAADKNFKYNDDGTYITMSKSVSLIQSPNYFLYLMAAACITGIVFAIKGKPAVYLVCGIGGAVLGVFNYLMNFSSIDAVLKSNSYTKLAKVMGQYGISLSVDKGIGAVLLLIGAIGMIVAAIVFLNNHAAYDN